VKVNLHKHLQRKRNLGTAERIQSQLTKLSMKRWIVLANAPSSHPEKNPNGYEIRLTGHVIYCTCDGFKYRSECTHMKRFQEQVKPFKVK
jgi:hypothetical protein